MEIQITPEDNYQYIQISGRLDAINAGELQEKLIQLTSKGINKLIVSLEHVEYISSSGLRAFLAIAKKMDPGGFIRFCLMHPSVKEVFIISGFNTIFGIFDSKEEAVLG
ncbi:MAG: STAS domain-containing protein [Bacteroidetes bacterium]|nr:STAS domain-containing protein [Bacteroidota bacterium]